MIYDSNKVTILFLEMKPLAFRPPFINGINITYMLFQCQESTVVVIISLTLLRLYATRPFGN